MSQTIAPTKRRATRLAVGLASGRRVTVALIGTIVALVAVAVVFVVATAAQGPRVVSAPADAGTAFTAADERLHVLQRRSASGKDDVVVRSSPANPEPEVVLAAPRIQSFAHAGDVVAAVELLDDGSGVLRFTSGGQQQPATLVLPEPGVVRSIAGSTTHPLIGFTVAGDADAASTLYTVDVSSAVGDAPSPVLGLDGAPLAVVDWLFVPGEPSIVAQDRDGTLHLVDVLGVDPPSLLGSHAELRGVLPGTKTLVVADPDRGATIDLESGETKTFTLPIGDLPDEAYPGHVTALDRKGAHLLEVALIDAGSVAASLVARVDASGTVVVYPAPEGSRILRSCVSPSGRLVAVETAGAAGTPDGYPTTPSYTGTLTTLVEVSTGRVVLSLAGGLSDWCR